MRQIRRFTYALSFALLTSSCGDGSTTPSVPVPTSIALSADTVTLNALEATASVTAVVKDQDGKAMSGQTVIWTSANPGIVTVAESGLLTATGNGQATVTATSGSLSAPATVTVAQVATQVIPVGGDQQTAMVGEALAQPLAVELRDRRGHPVPGGTGGLSANSTVTFRS
jgi:uncharacterized protein YjdB